MHHIKRYVETLRFHGLIWMTDGTLTYVRRIRTIRTAHADPR
jgi:hypothetical protein